MKSGDLYVQGTKESGPQLLIFLRKHLQPMLNAMFGDDYDLSNIEIVGQVDAQNNVELASQILTATLGSTEHA